MLICRDTVRQRLVEAATRRETKALTKQSDPLAVGGNRQCWAWRNAELRQDSPLLLIADEPPAQLGVQRVDGLDQIKRSTGVSGEAHVIQLGVAPADVAGNFRVDVDHVDALLDGRGQSHWFDRQRLHRKSGRRKAKIKESCKGACRS